MKRGKSVKRMRKFSDSSIYSESECDEAIGYQNLSNEKKVYFENWEKSFRRLNKPRSGDWLDEFNESPQSFKTFVSQWKNNKEKVDLNKTVYLQTIGDFEDKVLDSILKFTICFFGGKVKVKYLPQYKVDSNKETKTTIRLCKEGEDQKEELYVRSRINEGVKQIRTGDVIGKIKVPTDQLCTLVLTMFDLYPSDSWNFVFGEADPERKVGIFSFSRQVPGFPKKSDSKGLKEKDYSLFILRCLKIVVHEILHMFMLGHCVYFKCVMCGANHLKESDSHPLFLCPICLRKIEYLFGFDIMERYDNMLKFFTDNGIDKERKWTKKRIKFINSNM